MLSTYHYQEKGIFDSFLIRDEDSKPIAYTDDDTLVITQYYRDEEFEVIEEFIEGIEIAETIRKNI